MPEVRLIDANALKKKYCDCCAVGTDCMGSGCKIYDARCLISDLPTVEAKPVKYGRWIQTEYDSYADGSPVWDKYECSECGHEHSGEEDTLTAFCPDCGARMDAKCGTAAAASLRERGEEDDER